MEETTRRTSADPSTSSTRSWRVLHPHAGPSERLQNLDSTVELQVRASFRLVEALALQEKVRALIAHRPAAIVLDVDGLLPLDELGVLMLPTVAREAAAVGTAVLLANPSRPLHDRVLQLGISDLTFVERPAPAAHADDAGEGGADSHDEGLPSSPCPFCGTPRRSR